MADWYSLWSFVIFFPIGYIWTKRNLATLPPTSQNDSLPIKRMTGILSRHLLCKTFAPLSPGLPNFSWYGKPKWEHFTKLTTKYTKRPLNKPNGNKIYRILPFQGLQKYIRI
jgi:hypothetical protein